MAVDPLALAAEGAVAFGSTFAGVGVALWFDHARERRRAVGETEARKAELAQILHLLADAVQYDYVVLRGANSASDAAWKVAELLRMRTGAWEANRERLMALCHDPQTKTDFAVFFEDIERLLRLAQMIHAGGLERGFAIPRLTQMTNDAIESARQIVGKHGTPPQRRGVGFED